MTRFERALAKVVENAKAEFGADLLGMLLGGSVAYGEPSPRSDLDVYAIIRPPWRQRRAFSVDGVEVDLFINPVAQIRRELAPSAGSSTIAMFAHGRTLYDPEGAIAELVAEARRVWAQGPPEVSPEDTPRLRYGVRDALDDALDLADMGDQAGAEYALGRALEAILHAHFRIARQWVPKPKYTLRDLRETDPGLAALASRALSGEPPLAARCAATAELAERVLAPIGGLVTDWTTEPEAVDDL